MKLTKLLERLDYKVVAGSDNIEITELVNDSRKVVPGSVFVCISGAVSDGHQYVKDVAEKGAAAVIVEKDVEVPEGLTVIKVEDTRYALALMSAAYFGYPAEKLKTIGITGTKGKTTTTYMVKAILEEVGHKVGLIGTIEAIIGDKTIPSNNTTPESYTIQKYFAQMVEAGCDCVVMEVSSQGLMLHRTAGIMFDIGIFTNLGEDHIGPNEHKDFEDYKRCKGLLFKQCKVGIGNVDDKWFEDVFKGAMITTGAVSVGKKDIVPVVLGQIGAQILFRRANIQPGTPTTASVYQDKLILSLSGNPYAAYANFELYFWPLLASMLHNAAYDVKVDTAILQSEYTKVNKMRRLIRARAQDGYVYLPAQVHASSVINNLLECNCMIDLEANRKVSIGDTVKIRYFK